jgi:hypothetical protein
MVGLAVWRKASRASKVPVCRPCFWVGSRFLVGFGHFWSILEVAGLPFYGFI